MDSISFLNAIFQDSLGDGRKLVIWTHPDKVTRLFDDVQSASQYGLQRAADSNVYFGLSLMSGVADGRGKYENTAAVGCLWADIDIAGSAHKKKNLPGDIKTAQTILDRVGLPASILVHSGHGLQAYWLLTEPWIFESDQERKKAAALASGWVGTIRAVAAALDFDADAVGDLTRVFRLPGTLNHKDPSKSVNVRIIETNEKARYSPDDFDPLLIAPEFEPPEAGNKKSVATVVVGAVMLDARAEPPALKLLAMLENDVKFKRTWRRTRTDLQDQSASSYDMSLANLAVLAEWTDQEIANLIIAWRRENKEDLVKALRRDYIMRTIAKAKAGVKQDQAISNLAQQAERITDKIGDTDSAAAATATDQRKDVLEQLSSLLRIQIVRWIQHGRENARYSMQLADGQWIRMGTATDILSMNRFRTRIYEACGVLMSGVKQDQWDDVARVLARCAELVENEEATSAYQAEQWVASYLSDHIPVKGEEWQEAAAASEPFIKDKLLHIHAGELRKHMRVLQHENTVTHVELCDCLKTSGFSRISVTLRFEGQTLCRSFWATDRIERVMSVREDRAAESVL